MLRADRWRSVRISVILTCRKEAASDAATLFWKKIWNVAEEHISVSQSGVFFLDGIKRDRWIWSGDAYQSYMISQYLFADPDICKRTMLALRGRDPVVQHINTILRLLSLLDHGSGRLLCRSTATGILWRWFIRRWFLCWITAWSRQRNTDLSMEEKRTGCSSTGRISTLAGTRAIARGTDAFHLLLPDHVQNGAPSGRRCGEI